jgi:hypothetical protein
VADAGREPQSATDTTTPPLAGRRPGSNSAGRSCDWRAAYVTAGEGVGRLTHRSRGGTCC